MIKTKLLTVLIFTILFSLNVSGQDDSKTSGKYNAELAKKLGADQYGMKSYVMVVLKTGPNDAKITDKEKRAKLFAGHQSNMGRLAKGGKLAFAGPFFDGRPLRGLLIFNVKTIEEAEDLVKTDPAVKAGIFHHAPRHVAHVYAVEGDGWRDVAELETDTPPGHGRGGRVQGGRAGRGVPRQPRHRPRQGVLAVHQESPRP